MLVDIVFWTPIFPTQVHTYLHEREASGTVARQKHASLGRDKCAVTVVQFFLQPSMVNYHGTMRGC